MSIFPPSGYKPNAADGTDPTWTLWFAWFPVTVDVYDPSEINRGQLHYRVWLRWVECRETPDAPPPNDFARMQYRLPPLRNEGAGTLSRDNLTTKGE